MYAHLSPSETVSRTVCFSPNEVMPEDASNIVAFPGGDSASSASVPGIRSIPMRSDLVAAASKVIFDAPVLINLVSARVKQLNNGRAPLVKVDHRMGAADIALTEIIEGKIGFEQKEKEA